LNRILDIPSEQFKKHKRIHLKLYKLIRIR